MKKVLHYRRTFSIFASQFGNCMKPGYLLFFVFGSLPAFSQDSAGTSDQTLIQTIIVLAILLLVVFSYEFRRYFRKKRPGGFSSFFSKVQLEVLLDKDRPLRPQVLTMTIRNTGQREADIDAPVLEFRKIWSQRKFKLKGVSKQQIYPMFLDPGKLHRLKIETSTFHQYDKSLKSYYWARIFVSDVDGRKWKSNKVKLRKSLFT
jgi:hypothetical protein